MSTSTPIAATAVAAESSPRAFKGIGTVLALVAFVSANVVSMLAGTAEVLGSIDPWTWDIHRPLSGLAVAFWLFLVLGAIALLWDRREQGRREQELNGSLEAARRTVSELERGQRKLEEGNHDLSETLEQLKVELQSQSAMRTSAERESLGRLNRLQELQETLPPDNLLVNYAYGSVSSLNLLVDALRTRRGDIGTAEANDRIRTVLGWMASIAQLYARDPADVVFGAFVSLYYESLETPARDAGWSGTLLPAPGQFVTGMLVDVAELSVRLEGIRQVVPMRDPEFKPAAWPVPRPGQQRGLSQVAPGNGWLPGPQEAFATGKSSQFDDLAALDEWAAGKRPWNSAPMWQPVRAHLDEWMAGGMRSVVSYPLVQYDAKTVRLAQLGSVTVHATEPGVFGNDVRAERLANLLSPLRAIVTGLLIRRAEADPSRWIPFDPQQHWHGC